MNKIKEEIENMILTFKVRTVIQKAQPIKDIIEIDSGILTTESINRLLKLLKTFIKKELSSLIEKERKEIIYILKQQKPICAGSCGSGCEYLVEKLIKELEKK